MLTCPHLDCFVRRFLTRCMLTCSNGLLHKVGLGLDAGAPPDVVLELARDAGLRGAA